MNKYKNLVFDLGNVLVEFKPKDYMKRIGFSEIEIEELYKIIFDDKRWNELDRGTITLDEYIGDLKQENPSKKESINKIFDDNWPTNLFKIKTNTVNALEKLSKDYNIYILSNTFEEAINFIKTLDFWKYISGGTYSYILKLNKPEKEIYEEFLKINNLKPEECFFFDDREENIDGAKKVRN